MPAACLLLVAAAGCTTTRLRDAGAAQAAVGLVAVPFYAQTEHQCGPAALAASLQASGVAIEPDALVREVYLPALKGSLQVELQAAARRHGRLAYRLPPTLPALVHELDAGRPVLVLQNFGLVHAPLWHYAVVIGYDRTGDRFLLRTGTTRRQALAAARFDGTWRRAGRWGLVMLRPGEIPSGASAAEYVSAAQALAATAGPALATPAFEAAVMQWPDEGLTWFALGNARLSQDDPRGAEAAFGEALARHPGDAAARNNLALLLARRGCTVAARAQIERALADSAGTALAATVEESVAEIGADEPAAATGCPVPPQVPPTD